MSRHLHLVDNGASCTELSSPGTTRVVLSGRLEPRACALRPLAGPGRPQLLLGLGDLVLVVEDAAAVEVLRSALARAEELAEWAFASEVTYE